MPHQHKHMWGLAWDFILEKRQNATTKEDTKTRQVPQVVLVSEPVPAPDLQQGSYFACCEA